MSKEKKSTEANTTLKDKLKDIKNKKSSSFTEEDDIPQRMSRGVDMSPLKLKEFKSGGRVNLRGGGCAKRGVKKNAYGKNS
jgi:hypothetical protein